MFYAYVEVVEWGEETREMRIGPIWPEDDSLPTDLQMDVLRDNLESRGERVCRIEVCR